MCSDLIRRHDRLTHECGKTQCNICKQPVHNNHLCHIQKVLPPKPDKGVLIVFDFESTQDDLYNDRAYRHKVHYTCSILYLFVQVNLCCAYVSCNLCFDTDSEQCTRCGQRQWSFFGADAVGQFCTWLFTEPHKGAIAMAHNLRGYDGQFILDYIHSQAIRPTLITRGLEIMMMEAGGIKFLDSLNFIPMSVSAMPKAFG